MTTNVQEMHREIPLPTLLKQSVLSHVHTSYFINYSTVFIYLFILQFIAALDIKQNVPTQSSLIELVLV